MAASTVGSTRGKLPRSVIGGGQPSELASRQRRKPAATFKNPASERKSLQGEHSVVQWMGRECSGTRGYLRPVYQPNRHYIQKEIAATWLAAQPPPSPFSPTERERENDPAWGISSLLSLLTPTLRCEGVVSFTTFPPQKGWSRGLHDTPNPRRVSGNSKSNKHTSNF